MFDKLRVFFLLASLMAASASTAAAQSEHVPDFSKLFSLDVAMTALQTEAEKSAVGFAADLVKNPTRVFQINCVEADIRSGQCNQGRNYGWYFDLAPDIHVLTGSEDAFQSIVGKVSGRFMFANLITPEDAGLGSDFPVGKILDYGRVLHVFPLSAGVETTRTGDTLNAVGEIGYVPYLLTPVKNLSAFQTEPIRLGVNPRLGVFVQAGQKIRQEAAFDVGGARDESSEAEGKGIARLKSVASMQLLFPMRLLGLNTGISVEPSATGWYDLVNEEVYYSLKLSMGIALLGSGGERSTLWEFTIQDGSGEPNFTEGTQFGTGLKLVY